MLTPIVCFTCGLPLGDKAPIYHIIRSKRMAAAHSGEAAETPQAAVDPSLTESIMGDVLDALKVYGCCRTRLVTAMIFSEHY